MPFRDIPPTQIRRDFTAVSSIDALATLLQTTPKTLEYYAWRPPEENYRSFSIPKKSGGSREIVAPCEKLKTIQKKLSHLFSSLVNAHPCSHGFIRDRSIVTNARRHEQKSFLVNFDLSEFFPSIHFGRIHGLLQKRPFNFSPDLAMTVARLCCWESKLPQGAPTSPILSNFICRTLDKQFLALAKETRGTYTRYADDITFSFRRKIPQAVAFHSGDKWSLGDVVVGIVKHNGFSINPVKTRLASAHERMEVTGLIVNQKVNVHREFVRNLRGAIHAVEKFGLPKAQETFKDLYGGGGKDLLKVLKGRLDHLGFVKGSSDGTYQALLGRLYAIAPGTFGAKEFERKRISKDLSHTLERYIWVLESDRKGEEKPGSQGTAFVLKGIGTFTCNHVLDGKMIAFRVSDPGRRIPIRVLWQDERRDLARIEIEGIDESKGLEPHTGAKPKRLDPILLAGFPSHIAGQGIHLNSGKLQTPSSVR